VRFDLPSGPIYKIGITNRTVKQRFSNEKTPYVILWQERHEDGSIPPKLEKTILKKYKKYQYKGDELESGNTECFTIDILGYDKSIAQLKLIA
jgi:hypothetical protein